MIRPEFDIVSTVIRRRRSIRKFNSKPVELDLVKNIIDTASHAPSNNNRQGWKFAILQDDALKKNFRDQISEALAEKQARSKLTENILASYKKHFVHFVKAPVVIVCCFRKPNTFQKEMFSADEENRHMSGELISLSLVIQNMLLLAESVDLGTLVMTSPLLEAGYIKGALQIPNNYSIGAFVCMGYYDTKPEAPQHYDLDRILLER